jgi:hypothetical protein
VPYSSMTYRLLVSTPGDVSESDVDVVIQAINRWNAIYGRQFGAVVLPTHWRQHSAAEHGDRPQGSLNEQLVDESDAVLAIFWSRLGTPTGEAESGTQEEIERAHENGAYVAILRCEREVDPTSLDGEQVARLQAFLDELQPQSLMLPYRDDADLARHVDAVLTRVVTRESERAEAAAEVGGTPSGAEVWPRVESSENVKTDTRGRAKTERRWQLVLTNTGSEPASNVRFRFEPENEGEVPPEMFEADRPLEALPPGGGEASYGLFMHSGVASQIRCVVSWEDSAGSQENTATLRFF